MGDEREFQIKITGDASSLVASSGQARQSLSGVSDTAKEGAVAQEQAGQATEKHSVHLRGLHKIFHALNEVVPGLGAVMQAAFSPIGAAISIGALARTALAGVIITGNVSITGNVGVGTGGGTNTCTAPSIIADPANTGCVTNGSTQFSVTASGTAPLSYQWQTNSVNVNDGLGWTGTATSTLIFAPGSSTQYNGTVVRCAAINACGTNYSATASLAVTNAPAPPPDITNGLVFWYKFDDGSGASATDSSGNGHTASLSGSPTWSAGQVGTGSIFLNASNSQYADTTYQWPVSLSNFTVSCWFKTTNTTENILGNYGGSAASINFHVENNGQLTTSMRDASGTYGYSASSTDHAMNNGSWHHVVMTQSGTTTTLYVAGASDKTGSEPALTNGFATTATVKIGNSGAGGNLFTGYIDDVRLYNYVLSTTAITTLYNYR